MICTHYKHYIRTTYTHTRDALILVSASAVIIENIGITKKSEINM